MSSAGRELAWLRRVAAAAPIVVLLGAGASAAPAGAEIRTVWDTDHRFWFSEQRGTGRTIVLIANRPAKLNFVGESVAPQGPGSPVYSWLHWLPGSTPCPATHAEARRVHLADNRFFPEAEIGLAPGRFVDRQYIGLPSTPGLLPLPASRVLVTRGTYNLCGYTNGPIAWRVDDRAAPVEEDSPPILRYRPVRLTVVGRDDPRARSATLASRSLRHRSTRIPVRLRCRKLWTCRGRVTIKAGRLTVASRPYRIAKATTSTVTLTARVRARATIAGAASRRVGVRLAPTDGSAELRRMTLRR